MPLTKCAECDKDLSSHAGVCPHCGYPLSTAREAIHTKNVPQLPKFASRHRKFAGVLFVVGIAVVILLVESNSSPDVSVNGTTGRIHVRVLSTGTADGAGYDVAQKVWQAAHEHPGLTEIDAEVEYSTPGDLADKYGHQEPRPYIMGTMPVRSLDNIRKYVSEDDYASDVKNAYGLMIRSMK